MKQKRNNHIAVILSLIGLTVAALTMYMHSQQQPVKQRMALDAGFCVGDTLFPCDFCPDTLIVTNAVGINGGFITYDTMQQQFEDYQLDSILHANCRQLSPALKQQPETAGEQDSTPFIYLPIH